ncbi:MAG TPA: SDR family NAD(P)-dependent oxidoreductase, partial [Pseudomonadales bacterium]|nr:SDR family NAD(P)-dependent oxidoreductase [Pseudomonadales bacterium]
FNNAGIAVIGNVLKMAPEHWDRLVDVNIRGVHHGVEAAYATMVAQGSGHIVNTASVAGLIPTPGFTAYGMTKHAVVGLSVSLRPEAERYGVKVSAVCPGVINSNMAETAQLLGHDKRLKEEQPGVEGKLPTPDYCARKVLAGVKRNKAIIAVTASAHIGWRLHRFLPAFMRPVTRRMAEILAPLD